MRIRAGSLLAGALAALALAVMPLVGWWAGALAGVFLLLAVLASLRAVGAAAFAPLLGVVGGAVGAVSAIGALLSHRAEPQYAVRAGFGWVALAFALVAVAGGALAMTRPGLAAALLCLCSLLGFVAINLYDINTAYAIAPIGCGTAAVLALGRIEPYPAAPR